MIPMIFPGKRFADMQSTSLGNTSFGENADARNYILVASAPNI